MGLALAFKAFFKAFKEPEKAKQFVEGQQKPQLSSVEAVDVSHLRLLRYLQEAGRLVDFLQEDMTSFSDAQVGAAVRKIHQDCRQVLEELVTIRPLKEEKEGDAIQVPKGYDPSQIKIVGKVKGEPPFSGILVHKGWVAHKRSLPKQVGEQTTAVICPAEIEVK